MQYSRVDSDVKPITSVGDSASSVVVLRLLRGYRRNLAGIAMVLIILAALAGCTQPTEGPDSRGDDDSGVALTWVGEDIGSVGLLGTFEDEPGSNEMVVYGAGSDIWSTEDSFHFVYVAWTGDVDFQARIDAISNTHNWAKVGLMVRSELSPSSNHGFVGLTPTGTIEFLHRDKVGAETLANVMSQHQMPIWLRIRRTGSAVEALISDDTIEWTKIGQADVGLQSDVLVGVAVTSRDTRHLAEAVIRNLRLSSVAGGEPTRPSPAPPDTTEPPPPDNTEPPPPYTGGGVQGSEWACSRTPLSPRYEPTYFVSTSGSDSNDGRSEASPFRSLQHAARLVGPGDVVWVRGGVYSSNIAFEQSGSAGSPIVFESFPGECAILDGSGQSRLERLQFWNLRFNVFRNFIVRNSPGEGIFLSNVSNSQFSHLRLHHNSLSGILSMYGNQNVFSRFVSHDNFDRPNGGDADGISIASGSDNKISNCVTYNNSDDGVDTWLSTRTVVDSCVSFKNGFSGGDGNGFKAGGDNRNVGTIIRRSVAFGNRVNGFTWNTGTGVTLEHNTAFDNNLYGFVANEATLRNNLSIANGGGPFSGESSRNNQVTNSWTLGVSEASFTSTASSEAGFLSLGAASNARGVARDIGFGTDLGAIPFGQTLSSYLGIGLDAALGGPQ